jgi:lipopolysaccharide transport system permease protein
MFASPVAYAAALVPEKYRLLYSINPAVAFVEGTRWAILGASSVTIPMVALTTVLGILVFIGGAFFFRRTERGFADHA